LRTAFLAAVFLTGAVTTKGSSGSFAAGLIFLAATFRAGLVVTMGAGGSAGVAGTAFLAAVFLTAFLAGAGVASGTAEGVVVFFMPDGAGRWSGQAGPDAGRNRENDQESS
jgi:hypothetical protein